MITGPGIARQAAAKRALLATPRLADEMVARAGQAALGAYSEGFAAQQDPYGAGWESTESGGPILFKTGALANPALDMKPGQFRITSAPYGHFHQHGWNPGHSRKSLLRGAAAVLGPRPGKGSTKDERREYRAAQSLFVKGRRFDLSAAGGAHVPARRIQPSGGDPGRWGFPIKQACSDAARAHFKLGGGA